MSKEELVSSVLQSLCCQCEDCEGHVRRAVEASHTPVVSVEGEKAAEEYWLNESAEDMSCNTGGHFTAKEIRKAYFAGFQARSPLVELLREAKEVIPNDVWGEPVIAKIDATLKGEK